MKKFIIIFLRNISKSRKNTPIYTLYGELGRTPIDLHIKSPMVGFRISLTKWNDSKFAKKVYNIIYDDYTNIGITTQWIICIKQILISVGKLDLFLIKPLLTHKARPNRALLKHSMIFFVQDWNAKIDYLLKKVFTQNIKFESFFTSWPFNY